MKSRVFKSSYLVSLLFIFVTISYAEEGHYYYTCSYAEAKWRTGALFSKIDLDSKSIVFSVQVPIIGGIELKKPARLHYNGKSAFFIGVENGLWGKNVPAGGPIYTTYAVLDDSGKIISTGDIPNIFILHSLESVDSNPNPKLEYQLQDTINQDLYGYITLDNEGKPLIVPLAEVNYNDSIYPNISGFQYFKQIDVKNEIIYWDLVDKGTYLLRIDKPNLRLIDSLNISANMEYFYLFGLSSNNSIIYSFYIDCICKGWRDPGEIQEIVPSYLKRFSSDRLSILDSMNISNPCLDSACIGSSWDDCERVGNYLIYFFMGSEGIEQFFPAMLFIFDTRTNKATWLRVGWR